MCVNGTVIDDFDVWIISACFLSKHMSGYITIGSVWTRTQTLMFQSFTLPGPLIYGQIPAKLMILLSARAGLVFSV